jgi:hypothetical protein
MKIHLILALLAVASLPTVAPAQQKPPEVEFRATRFDPADGESPKFEVGAEADRTEVMVPMTYIAGPFKAPLRDGRFLDFWGGDSEKPELSLAITEAERKDLLLFFIPVDDGFKVIKVRTPESAIAGGDRYLINACNRRIAIKAGKDDPLQLEPGKGGVIRAPRGGAATMPVLISIREADSWKAASTETWYHDPRFRKYLFAYLHPRSGHLVFHAVSEKM